MNSPRVTRWPYLSVDPPPTSTTSRDADDRSRSTAETYRELLFTHRTSMATSRTPFSMTRPSTPIRPAAPHGPGSGAEEVIQAPGQLGGREDHRGPRTALRERLEGVGRDGSPIHRCRALININGTEWPPYILKHNMVIAGNGGHPRVPWRHGL